MLQLFHKWRKSNEAGQISAVSRTRVFSPDSVVSHVVGERWTDRVRAESAERDAVEVARNRVMVGVLLFSVCFVVLIGRLVDLMVLTPQPDQLAQRPPQSAASAPDLRQDVVDRRGTLLATTLRTSSVYANPRVMLDIDEAAEKLSTVLPDTTAEELHKLFSRDRAFVWVKRHLSPRLESRVNALGIPGVHFIKEQRRIYPHGPLAVHAVGATNVDNQGLLGVELAFNDRLMAADVTDLRLALDVRVQHAMRDELLATIEKFSAIAASGVVMDVRTGEVISMVSLPDFDPHGVAQASDNEKFNRVTLGVYELGSVFKTLTVAQALDRGTVGIHGGYDATQPIRVGGRLIRDYRGKKRWLSVSEIFMHSSNIGTAKMAMDIGAQNQEDFLRALELDRAPQFEINEVSRPLFPTVWRDARRMTVAFGHGIGVSPLQFTRAMSAMVNGGVLPTATLLPHDADTPSSEGARVISERTSDQMRRMLHMVVHDGTAKKARAPGYAVGGKTGTAEKPGPGGYIRDKLLSSFIATFPANDPQYAVYVVIDEPKGIEETFGYATAGWTAAPTVGRVVSRIAPLLGVAPVTEQDLEELKMPEPDEDDPAAQKRDGRKV